MSDNVVELGGLTKCNVPSERVLAGAVKANVQDVIVIGRDENDDIYFASASSNAADLLWALEVVKKRLLEIGDE